MELRSGRRVRRPLPTPPPKHGSRSRDRPGGADFISALPDELLLLVLARLRCARTAASTGLLSRRWRDIWTGLTDLIFREVPPAAIESVLVRFAGSQPVTAFTLDICLPTTSDPAGANSLLRAAAVFSPAELVFSLPWCSLRHTLVDIVLPCIGRATKIELDIVSLPTIRPPSTGEFAALEKLSLKGKIVDLDTMLDGSPRLRVLSLTFRGVDSGSIRAALASLETAAPRPALSLLDICIPKQDYVNTTGFAYLLHAAARVSPQKFVFTRESGGYANDVDFDADLPYFDGARSIEIRYPNNVCFTRLPLYEFSALEMLSLWNCSIVDMANMISCCPRLRVLTIKPSKPTCNITVHSASLFELDIHANVDCRRIDILTPVLKHLKLGIKHNPILSVSAPMVEKVSSWRYTGWGLLFGYSLPYGIKLESAPIHNMKNKCLHRHPVHVLILEMYADFGLGSEMDFSQELENLLVTNFSMLEIHLTSNGHVSVSGALVLGLFRIHRIQTATQKLKVILPTFLKKKTCQNCPCDEPKNWRRQRITLRYLEEVEISCFKGDHREFDLLKLILRCAPMLKKITVKLGYEITRKNCQGGLKIYNIFLAYPLVDSAAYLYSGERLVSCARG